MVEIRGKVNGNSIKIGIVAAQFNALVTTRLVAGAVNELIKYGVATTDITTVWVPGAMELPRVVQRLATSGQVAGIIALGAVVRGETSHYDFVCNETASGLATVALSGPVPVMFGVLTTDNMAQALDRAGGKAGNKGRECASGVLEMISVESQI